MEIKDSVFARYCNDLQCNEKEVRRKALMQIRNCLDTYDITSSSGEVLHGLFKQILRCAGDKSESCRDLSVTLITDFLGIWNHEYTLSYIMPVLTQRLSPGYEIVEPSEEVRLKLLILLHQVVLKYTSNLPPYLSDIVQILAKVLVDSYPNIKKEGCDCACDLAKVIPKHFHMQSEMLIKPILNNFNHQHYRIRVTSIYAIGDVIRYGNNKSVSDVIVPLAERLFDQTPMVRLAVTKVVGDWLLHLPDRYSFFHHLLPVMLSSLCDEMEDIRNQSCKLWDEIGKQYMEENEKDFKDELDFLNEELSHYPEGITRPNLGCRSLVYRNIGKFIPALVRDLDDWKPDIRFKSSQLLCVLILNSERNITHHIEKFLDGMYHACKDEDSRVVENMDIAAKYIGYFVPPETYCKLILPTMENNPTAGHLRVLAGVVRTSEKALLCHKIQEIMEFMEKNNICHSKEVLYQTQLLACCSAMMDVCGSLCCCVSQQLFTVIVTVLGLAGNSDVKDAALDCLEKLRKIEEFSSLTDVFRAHMRPLLVMLETNISSWSIYSSERFIFEALISNSGSMAAENLDVIVPIFCQALEPDNDAELKLKIFIVLSSLFQGGVLKKNWLPYLSSLITEVLVPNLLWKAGRTAEAIRTIALTCTYIILKDVEKNNLQSDQVHQLLESLLPLLLSLVEDPSTRSRQTACKCISELVRLCREHSVWTDVLLHKIYPVILDRLDDSSDVVRQISLSTLVCLFASLPNNYQVSLCETHIDLVFRSLLIHLDDPEESFRSEILDGLKKIAHVRPKLLLEKVKNMKGNYQNNDCCSLLETYLQTLNIQD